MIVNSATSTAEAKERIKRGMRGHVKPIKTRFDHFNTIAHGGLIRQKIYCFGALSSFGKSFVLRQLEEDIFNPKLNPGATEHTVLAKIDMELTKEELILMRVHAKTDVDYERLMFETPDATTVHAFDQTVKELSASYMYESFEKYTPAKFYTAVKEFAKAHKDKQQIVITVDNINLVDTQGRNETEALSEMIYYLITLKQEIINITFIIAAQLNRYLKERSFDSKAKSGHFPQTTDFFYSSKIEHASDIQVIIHNPYRLGIMQYGAVNPDKYSYLSEYLVPSNKYASFRTKGLIFWHYVKVRLVNRLKDFKDIYVEEVFDVEPEDSEVVDNLLENPF